MKLIFRPAGEKVLANSEGFTLVELIMIVLLVSILSVAIVVKWPSGMETEAAGMELKRAIRYAQHMALTRAWSDSSKAWGITVSGNKYYVGRADAGCVSSCAHNDCAESLFCDRFLSGDSGMTLSSGNSVFFNGMGEPIDNSGNPLANTLFTVDGIVQMTVCRETGYVMAGGSCP